MKTAIVDSDRQKRYLITLIDELPTDGSMMVEVKKTSGVSTAKQMRLRWLWMGEVAKSGLGKYDTSVNVDLGAKYMFGVPILKRDDDIFAMLYQYFIDTVTPYVNYSGMLKAFIRGHVSISKLMNRKQQAEYLTNFQDYWTYKGVNLTDPAMQGVDLKWEKK